MVYKKRFGSWNKDKIGIYSPETIEKMRKAKIGHIPWNKGKKYKQLKIRKIKKGRLCKCNCGNIVKENSYYIRGHNKSTLGMKFSTEQIENISKAHIGYDAPKGEKSHSWKGGLTPLRLQIRNLKEYTNWRKQIFERDNFTCQKCRNNGKYINAHHIKRLSEILRENNIKNINDSILCKQLWDIANGITYCEECHDILKTKGGKL